MNGRYALIAVAALATASAVPGAWAQSKAGDTASEKIAVVNIQLAIASTGEGKQAAAELQARFTPEKNELDQLQKRIEDIQGRLRTGERTLSDEEKARLAREGNELSRRYQRKQQELSEDASDAQNDVIDRIGRKMLAVLDRYAQQNGYSLVLDISGQSTPVLYASNQVDVTQTLIKLYDQAYPVKAATAPASSAPAKLTPPPKPAPKR
jgi:outer membrane protein